MQRVWVMKPQTMQLGEGPVTQNGQKDGGNTDVDHMNTTPKETCKTTNKKGWKVSMKAHNDENAASKAQLHL